MHAYLWSEKENPGYIVSELIENSAPDLFDLYFFARSIFGHRRQKVNEPSFNSKLIAVPFMSIWSAQLFEVEIDSENVLLLSPLAKASKWINNLISSNFPLRPKKAKALFIAERN